MRAIMVDATSYPLLFKAHLTIQYDHGAINRYEPEPAGFLTAESAEDLAQAEQELAVLGEADFETFCIGEQTEQEDLCGLHGLHTATYILTEWFG